MNGDGSDVVRVRLEHMDALESVVVEYANLHVVRARHHPVLARNELRSTHGQVTHLEGLDELLVVDVPNVHVAVVETGAHPWLSGVEIAALDPVGAGRQPPLNVETKRLKEVERFIPYFAYLWSQDKNYVS